MNALIDGSDLVVCVGPGGVGKTTLAAALAVGAAEAGRRVALLTIDPARRLADALGLDGLDDRLQPVAGVSAGALEAAMLDTKASYDALIARVAEDPGARERILANRVYQSFSQTLARSHAYIAMERLHHVLERGDRDLVVLDTPPTRSALDILDAPGRLARFLDARVLSAFVGDGSPGWLQRKGGEVALKLFGAIAGEELRDELGTFFEIFLELRGGFVERADAMHARLRAPGTRFALVTAPDPTHLEDAEALRQGLTERGVAVDAVLFNRAFHPGLDGRPVGPGPAYRESSPLLVEARAHRTRLAEENRQMANVVERFRAGRRSARYPIASPAPADLPSLRALLAGGVEDR